MLEVENDVEALLLRPLHGSASFEPGGPYEMKFVDPPVLVTKATRLGGRWVLSMRKTVCGTGGFGLPPADHVGNWQS